LIKDFDNFQDHPPMLDPDMEPLIGRSLMALTEDDWRQMRSTLSPAFTGRKMREMFKLITNVGKQAIGTLKDQIGSEGKVADMEKFLSKFTIDVIASCAFGIDVDSFKNPDNEFQKISKSVVEIGSLSAGLKMLGYFFLPKFMQFFQIRMFNKKVCDYFKTAIIDVIEEREKKGIVRHDLINILMEVKKGKLTHVQEEEGPKEIASVEESEHGKSKVTKVWTDTDLIAQAFIFFFAGYAGVTQAMAYSAHVLATNKEVEEKLIQEIDELRSSLRPEGITYEKIRDMKYMDQFISEVLRMWPNLLHDRVCRKNYLLEFDNRKILIEKDMIVSTPIVGFHYDPNYFPNPEKFDPDRFSDENRGNINMDAYMPFGIGPRNCIGSRFALMELKTILYHLLSDFKFEACEKTEIPLKFSKVPLAVKPANGIWLNLKPRN
jgi:cytochrome P450 family 9